MVVIASEAGERGKNRFTSLDKPSQHPHLVRQAPLSKRSSWGSEEMSKFALITGVFLFAGNCAVVGAADSQTPTTVSPQPSVKRTVLRRADVPNSNYEVVYALAEIAANSSIGKHTHPGKVFGYLLEGSVIVLVDGSAPLEIKPGEAYEVASGAVHDERAGSSGAKILSVYTVEKGKPLATAVK